MKIPGLGGGDDGAPEGQKPGMISQGIDAATGAANAAFKGFNPTNANAFNPGLDPNSYNLAQKATQQAQEGLHGKVSETVGKLSKKIMGADSPAGEGGLGIADNLKNAGVEKVKGIFS
jgi:hypothetical protein